MILFNLSRWLKLKATHAAASLLRWLKSRAGAVASLFRSLKRKANSGALLLKLIRKRRAAEKAKFRKYYPIRWRTQGSVAESDVTAYLENEGKDKEAPLELLKNLYGSYKDIQEKLKIYSSTALVIFLYMAAYILEITLPITFTGFSLHRDPTVLAVLMTIASYFGFRAANAHFSRQHRQTCHEGNYRCRL